MRWSPDGARLLVETTDTSGRYSQPHAQLVDVAADGSGDRKVVVDLGQFDGSGDADWRWVAGDW